MGTVTQTLIDFALSPPIGVLNAHLDGAGPYGPGNHILTTWDNSGTTSDVNDTFGVVVQFNGAIPPELGLRIGFDDGGLVVLDEFADRLVQLVVLHQLLSGAWVATQVEDLHSLPFMVRWSEALPGKLGLYVLPHVSVDLFYLLVG
jgi:hypothetical protein